MSNYILLQRKCWYARLGIPVDLRPHFNGKRELKETLKTSDQRVAELKAMKLVGGWKIQFDALRGSVSATQALAAEFLPHPDGKVNPDTGMSDKDYAVDAQAEALVDSQKKAFYEVALGRATPTLLYLEKFLEQWEVEQKTKDMAKTAIKRVADSFKTLEMISVPLIYQMIDADTNGKATKEKNYGFVRQYFKYLKRMQAIPQDKPNPFEDLDFKEQKKNANSSNKRIAFKAAEVKKLIKAATDKGDTQLRNLIQLAAFTGARIEELCSLKVADVIKVDRVNCLNITDAKTEAGNREVPIHPSIADLVKELIKKSGDGYLFSGLTFNKYRQRSNAIGKRFGHMKTTQGFGKGHVFHCFRNTVATQLENAGVPEGVAADIVGHEKKTITYGLYSGGTSAKIKLDAVKKIKY
jgi:integrase